MFFMDYTYILVIIGVILCSLASMFMNSTFAKYSQVRNYANMTGAQVAERILHCSGVYDVRIERVSGNLTDHYDPRSKVLRLSDSTYNSTSIAAMGVAAHECGHVMQHAFGYKPLELRASLVPIANIGSSISWPLILIGLFIRSNSSSFFINAGILCFCAVVLFQLVTLPVEFNASNRAIKMLEEYGMVNTQEVGDARAVLSAAALTYVAGALSAILQLLRLILIAQNNNRRR
ncbi:MAG: zinc metallopeptidase [Bacillota bacterium]|nr:zinc metallopeptidase [Bacillota bacterium]